MSTRQTDPRAGRSRPRRARGWGRLWQLPAFALGCAAVALAALTAPLRDDPGWQFQRELRQLRRALHGGDGVPARLRGTVEDLQVRADAYPARLAEFHFLAGSYYYLRGEADQRHAEWRDKAAEHLSQALALGVPEDDLPTLYFRLGMARYRQGRHEPQALAWIKQGLDLGAEKPAGGYDFLVDVYLRAAPPNLAAALTASRKFLEYVDDRNPEAMGRARHRHADILARLGRRPEALLELERIEPGTPRPVLAQVRLLQAVCSEEEGQWPQALHFWQELEPLADEVPGGAGRVHYALGQAHLQTDPPDAAAAQAHWKTAAGQPGEAGQAAALRLGGLRLLAEPPDAAGALEPWAQALSAVRVQADYQNHYLDAAQLIELLEDGAARLVRVRQFEPALAVVELLGRVAPAGRVQERRARVYQEWGRELLARADAEKDPSAKELQRHEAWSRFQNAGDDFAQASLSRESKDKVEIYWQSAASYLAGQDLVKAAQALEKFVAVSGEDPRLARGHFSLAETYQAQGQKAKARAHFLKCIELAAPPYDDRARYRLARQELDGKNPAAAREILNQLVQRAGPGLERELHENALYLLGNLLYEQEEYDEAAVRLSEALRRFPSHAEAVKARDRLGEYYWDKKARAISAEATAPASERRPLAEAMRQKRREYLEEALKTYQDLDQELSARHRKRKLDGEELWVWRKALFSVGLVRMDLEEYGAALEQFRTLQQLYRGLESLLAARNAYLCWKKLTQGGDEHHPLHAIALEVIRSAARDLDAIPRDREDEFFRGDPHHYTREQWREFLAGWQGELRHVTLRINPKTFAPE